MSGLDLEAEEGTGHSQCASEGKRAWAPWLPPWSYCRSEISPTGGPWFLSLPMPELVLGSGILWDSLGNPRNFFSMTQHSCFFWLLNFYQSMGLPTFQGQSMEEGPALGTRYNKGTILSVKICPKALGNLFPKGMTMSPLRPPDPSPVIPAPRLWLPGQACGTQDRQESGLW